MLAGATVGLNWFMLVGRTTTSLFFVGEVIYKADLLSYRLRGNGRGRRNNVIIIVRSISVVIGSC